MSAGRGTGAGRRASRVLRTPPRARTAHGSRDRGQAPRVLRTARGRRDLGQASLEFLGMLPILILVALAGIQLGLVAYSASQAGTAARAAARMAARSDPPVSGPTAGEEAVSDWLNPSISMGGGSDTVTATASVEVPSLFGVRLGHVQRTATMPREDDDGGAQ